MSEDRYSRQKKIEGWDQQMLEDANIAMVGDGSVACFGGALMAALGIGRSCLYGNSRFKGYHPDEFMYAELTKGKRKVRGLEQSMKQINPTIDVESYRWAFLRDYFTDIFSDNTSAIFDTTNDPRTEAALFSHAMTADVPIVNASCKKFRGELSVYMPTGEFKHLTSLDHEEITKETPYQLLSRTYNTRMEQDPVTASLIAGLAVDEIRKIVMPLKFETVKDQNGNKIRKSKEPTLEGRLIYDILTDDLVHRTTKLKSGFQRVYHPGNFQNDIVAAVVGAGSLGNVVSLLLTIMGIKHYIFDKDIYEDANVNRQIMAVLYGNDVGKAKALSLAEKDQRINYRTKVVGVNDWFTPDTKFKGRQPDVIFDCTDKYTAMEAINYWSIKNKKPVITGHTGPTDGQTFFSDIYNGMECLDGRMNVIENANIERNPESCIQQSNPSVIIANWIMGSVMVDLFRRYAMGLPVVSSRVKYDTNIGNRLASLPNTTMCRYKDSDDTKHYKKCDHIDYCKFEV